MKSPATVAAAAGRHGRRSKKKLFGGRKLARTTSLFEKREDEGRISFFSEDELTRSEQEWRLPKPGKDEGEQLVGREILVERWGRGVVADFHDLTEFNKAEGHAVPWGSPHTIRMIRPMMEGRPADSFGLAIGLREKDSRYCLAMAKSMDLSMTIGEDAHAWYVEASKTFGAEDDSAMLNTVAAHDGRAPK